MARRANLKKGVKGPMKMKKGSFLEPDKEIKFGGPSKKYQGGGAYPVYGKNTDEAKSFRKAFAEARERGDAKFTWEGRSYGTRKAGESQEQYGEALKGARSANTPSTTQSRQATGNLSTGVTPRTGLTTVPRPTLESSSSSSKMDKPDSKATKREERKANRQERRAERKARPNRKQRAIKGSTQKSIGKKTAPAAPGTGMKVSTNTESTPNTRTRTSLSDVRDTALGRQVDTSKMKDSGTPGSRPAAKPAAPASKRADRINKRAERVTDRKAKRAAVSSAKENLKAARKMQAGGARKTMVPQRMEPNTFTKKYDSDSKAPNLQYGQTSVLNANKGEFARENSMSPSNSKKVTTKMQSGGVKECQSGGCYNSQRAARTAKKQEQARRNPKQAQRRERNAMAGRGKMANRKRRQQGRGSIGGKIGELAGLAGFGIGAKKMIDYIKENK